MAALASLVSIGCGGSAKLEAKASVDGADVDGSARFDSRNSETWDGDDEAGAPSGVDGPQGRLVEGHVGDSSNKATFPGFRQFEDGTSRVFLEVAGHVDVAESDQSLEKTGELVFRFEGVVVPEKVNQMALPTSHFDTPVANVYLKQGVGAAELHVAMRQLVKPKIHLKRTEGGTVLSLDFPRYNPGAQAVRAELDRERQTADSP
ncbi:MAG: hypothetical protein R3B72_16705 [Polyangiaceae bacterium]